MTRLPSSPPESPAALHVLGVAEELAERVLHPRPVASTRPGMPPALSGLPVTQARR